MMEASSISFQFLVQDLMLQFLPQAFVPSFFMQDADADTASVAASADGRCFLSSSKGLEFFLFSANSEGTGMVERHACLYFRLVRRAKCP